MQFPSTHWSRLILDSAAGQTAAIQALEVFCTQYRQPVRDFILWCGHAPHDADELTQEFFLRILRSDTLRRVDPALGRFRSFLMSALRHHLADFARRRGAVRRGGDATHVPIDKELPVDLVGGDTALPDGADMVFDRHWASQIVGNALRGVEREFAESGRGGVFRDLAPFLEIGSEPPSYEELASRLGITIAGLKTDVHRMRRRFRLLLRHEVGRTVGAPHEIDEEMRYLHRILAQPGFG